MKKLKVLLSAYACEPNRGSEPGVGWHWVRQISRFHDVWVVTRANNRPVVEAELLKHPLPNVKFLYYDLPDYLKFWKRGNQGVYLYYYLWQIGIFFFIRKHHRDILFDIIHHVTFVTYWMPSFLSLLPIKFVWGPVGGGEITPKSFRLTMSKRGRFSEFARYYANRIFEFDPFVRLTARRSLCALAVTKFTASRLSHLGAQRTRILSQVGLSSSEITTLQSVVKQKSQTFRILSIGNLLHWKGFHLSLYAFSRLSQKIPDAEYWIIGKGPESNRLKQQAIKLGISKIVTFWGAQPRNKVLTMLGQCDVLLHPSLHDSGAIVCAEAMGAGLPVICLDIGGPALQVTKDTGIKIIPITPEQTINELTEALLKLYRIPSLREQMGEAARTRVLEHFTWNAKGDLIHELYREIVPDS